MNLNKIEYKLFQKLIFEKIGINLSDTKLSLVQSRLYSRLIYHKIKSFSEYFTILKKDHKEIIHMINLITTNETYFFREQQHFDFLTSVVKNIKINQSLRLWSAASSVGAEAYSCAMILDNFLSLNQWEIVGTDINTEVIKKAKKGLYCESWIDKIPQHYKEKYCLKGKGRFEGQFIIDRKILHNINFEINNLTVLNSSFGTFDIIFLRNVFIYFDTETKQKVLNNVLVNLKVGGYLIISLTENLDGLDIKDLKKYQTSIYQKIR
ncbi:MAG: protein-glutamate O-methyltransferase CheR [Campylobacterota bacterium]|nr:protein-glutamate O-methyltransferase CheR [Campylobacterota bacterium]